MTIYLISNARQLTKRVVRSMPFKDNDKIIMFNGMYSYTFIKERRDQIISVQRPRTSTYMITNNIKSGFVKVPEMYIFDKVERKNTNIELDKKFAKLMKEKSPTTKIKEVVGCWEVFIKKFNFQKSPTSGIIALMFFDYYYPEEDKVLVGFTSNKSRPNSIMPRHDYDHQRNIMFRYCADKNFSFRYCVMEKGILKDLDPYEYYGINKNLKEEEKIERFKIEKELVDC